MEGEDEVSAIANFLSESGQLVSFEFSSPGECQTRRIRVPNRKLQKLVWIICRNDSLLVGDKSQLHSLM
jgi:hypothetical protein